VPILRLTKEKKSGAAVSTPDGKRNLEEGLFYDSVINQVQSRIPSEKVAK